MTKIAIVIVVTFVLLNMLRLILCFFEVAQMFTVMKCLGEGGLGQYQQSLHFHTSDNVARLLMVVNSSVNFLIYSCFSKSFQVNIKSNIQGKSKYRYLIKFPFSFRLLSLQRWGLKWWLTEAVFYYSVQTEQNKSIKVLFPKPKLNRTKHVKIA